MMTAEVACARARARAQSMADSEVLVAVGNG